MDAWPQFLIPLIICVPTPLNKNREPGIALCQGAIEQLVSVSFTKTAGKLNKAQVKP